MSDSLRLSANLGWLFTERPFEERFEAAADAGFGAVEYPSPYDLEPAFLARCLRDTGLTQTLINSPAAPAATGGGIACVPGRVSEFQQGLLRALDYAIALDAKLIHVLGGVRPPDVSPAEARATFDRNIAWAVDQASRTDVTLVLEAINQRDAPGFILESVADAAAAVRAVDHPQLRLLFDVYHCRVSGGDPVRQMQDVMPLVAHVQIADVPGRGEPGTGDVQWDSFFELIRAAGYGGWIGCEYRPAGNTVEGLSWRQQFCVGERQGGTLARPCSSRVGGAPGGMGAGAR